MTDDLKDLPCNPEPPRMLVDTAAWYSLEAENERLREALKELLSATYKFGADQDGYYIRRARQAIKNT